MNESTNLGLEMMKLLAEYNTLRASWYIWRHVTREAT